MKDGPLDMRMGLSGASAADILATWDVGDLRHLFRRLGEEPRAGRIARAIGEIRTTKPLTRTRELAQLVERVAGEGGAGRIHPATRVFQALRMAVNEELEELEAGLEAAEQILSAGGRLAVVSFHSLEDRIVKRFLQSRSGADAGPSRHAPEPPQGREPTFERLTKKPITPGEAECRHNPRARSARLRAARRTSAKSWPKLSEKLAA
jgi:16S rRNA (cytosine1402-N4)-methyltransferase